jgi:4-hydroxy-3-polyprenylbenzoate decarboxylase
MGIDATTKLEEEIDPSALPDMVNVDALSACVGEITSVVKKYSELKDLNLSLLLMGIPVAFVSIHKNRKGHVNEMANALHSDPAFSLVKVLIFLEDNMDISDVADAVWRFANNVDPRRDHSMLKVVRANEVDHVVFDGTRKTKAFDGFDRDWPNILASDEKTIKRIDEIWSKLGIGEFISSPSVKYSKQLYSGGAVANDQ